MVAAGRRPARRRRASARGKLEAAPRSASSCRRSCTRRRDQPAADRAAGHQLDGRAARPSRSSLDADPVRLAQVFSNLLNNAAKYTDRGRSTSGSPASGGATRSRSRCGTTGIGIAARDAAADLRDVHPGGPRARAFAGRAGHRALRWCAASSSCTAARVEAQQRRARAGQRVHRPPAARARPARPRRAARRRRPRTAPSAAKCAGAGRRRQPRRRRQPGA